MKKKLLFVAMTVLALASCSSDETVAVKQDSPISFRSLNNNLTRAADIADASDLKSFNVFAQVSDATTPTDLIGTASDGTSVIFTGPGTYNSANKYYWPASGTLDFYAWSANSNANGNKESNITVTDYKTYVVTVPKYTPGDPKDATEQPDFIYASSYQTAKAVPVALTFNHYESRIVLKVKNTANNLNFSVTGWKIVYPDETGTVTFSAFASGATRTATWTNNTTQAVANEFVSSFASPIAINANTTANQLGTNAQQMIMIPQDLVGPTPVALAYDAASPYKLNRAYIAIEYSASGSNTIASGWRCWPLPSSTTWEQGKQYTYVIDIADGGYIEVDPDPTDGDTNPKPELSGSLIQFASVSVTDWITDLNSNSNLTDDDIPLSGN